MAAVDIKVVLLGHKNVGTQRFLSSSSFLRCSWNLSDVLLGFRVGCYALGKTSIFNRYVYDDFGKTSMVRTRWAEHRLTSLAAHAGPKHAPAIAQLVLRWANSDTRLSFYHCV